MNATTLKTRDNLKLLDEVQFEYSNSERVSFLNYFIGALSMLVDERDWKDAIASANRCIATDRQSGRVL